MQEEWKKNKCFTDWYNDVWYHRFSRDNDDEDDNHNFEEKNDTQKNGMQIFLKAAGSVCSNWKRK